MVKKKKVVCQKGPSIQIKSSEIFFLFYEQLLPPPPLVLFLPEFYSLHNLTLHVAEIYF